MILVPHSQRTRALRHKLREPQPATFCAGTKHKEKVLCGGLLRLHLLHHLSFRQDEHPRFAHSAAAEVDTMVLLFITAGQPLRMLCAGRGVKRGDVCYGILRAAACVDESNHHALMYVRYGQTVREEGVGERAKTVTGEPGELRCQAV